MIFKTSDLVQNVSLSVNRIMTKKDAKEDIFVFQIRTAVLVPPDSKECHVVMVCFKLFLIK